MITTKILSINFINSVAGVSLSFSLSTSAIAMCIEDIVDDGNDLA